MKDTISKKERVQRRNKKIKMFYKLGYSMDEVCAEMNKLGYSVSKTTVFFAINGRSTKATDRQRKKRSIIRKLKKI